MFINSIVKCYIQFFFCRYLNIYIDQEECFNSSINIYHGRLLTNMIKIYISLKLIQRKIQKQQKQLVSWEHHVCSSSKTRRCLGKFCIICAWRPSSLFFFLSFSFSSWSLQSSLGVSSILIMPSSFALFSHPRNSSSKADVYVLIFAGLCQE